jgi:hypothetical protein
MRKPKLTLIPVDHTDWGEIVVETDTLLGRSTQPFTSKESPEFAELSRQHARIFLKEDAFYIVDLGSRNGTTLNGEEVTGAPTLIANGDEIALAKKISFRARLNGESNFSEGMPRLIPKASDPLRTTNQTEDLTEDTILFSASDRFLEGFYEQEDATRMTDSFKLLDSPAHQRKSRRVRLTFGLVLAAVALGLMGVLYFRGSVPDPKERIEALLRQGQFDEAYEAATTHLRAHPNDAAMAGLWLDSFANRIGRDWLSSIDKKQFSDAGQALQEAQVTHSVRPEAKEFLGLLAWATGLEKFLYDREKQPKIELYQDEYEIHRLLDDWNRNKPRYQSAMEALSRRSALFQSRADSLWGSLSTFLNQYALHLDAIDQLKMTVGDKLEAHKGQALLHDLNDFEAAHPEVAGVDRLKNDLVHYLAIERTIGKGELAEASRLRQGYQFRTPPFVERASRLFEGAGLPQ